VEKSVQEVYWRRYWKSWLALRPEVWSDFLAAAAEDDPRVRRIAEGQSGNAVIDHFANELVTTGYLLCDDVRPPYPRRRDRLLIAECCCLMFGVKTRARRAVGYSAQ